MGGGGDTDYSKKMDASAVQMLTRNKEDNPCLLHRLTVQRDSSPCQYSQSTISGKPYSGIVRHRVSVHLFFGGSVTNYF